MSAEDRYYVEGDEPETPQPAEPPAPWKETRVVGKPLPRIDAYERVSGSAQFPSDVILPDMLYGAILRSPHANAVVKSVDISAAERMPGVRAVIAAQTPGANPQFGRQPLFDAACRAEGDEVAAVAAETPYQAWDAVRAIKVVYEVLPHVSDIEDAVKPGAPAVQPGGNLPGKPQVYQRGSVADGFAQADVVKEQTFRIACEIHSPMETHGCVAKWDGSRLTVWESTQGVYPVQAGVASALNLPLSSVRVIGTYMGGGFGSKLSAGKYTIIAALLARKAARPVRLFLTREENFLAVGNRPGNTMTIKAGAKKDGTLTALEMKITGSGGAYGGGVGSVDFQLRDLYLCPNVRSEAQDILINAGQQRAFRAPGHPQGNWALEQMMDVLAEAIGMDPVAFRLKNVPTVSQADQRQRPYSTTGLKECLTEGAKAFGWEEARKRAKATGTIRRGVGVAAGLWSGGAGGPPSTCIVKLFRDGSASLNMGASDLGCGTKTVMSQVVSEELGVPLDRIHVEHADTGTTQYASASGGSKTVPTESPAVRAAALEVRRQVLVAAAEQLKLPFEDLAISGSAVVSVSDPSKKLEVSAIDALRRQQLFVGVGYRGPNPDDRVTRPFGAHFAEVEVNMGTGEVKVLRYVAAQDSGRVMNRLTYENQVFGGVTMGLGLGLMEERILDRGQTGKMVNGNLYDYKIPTALDVAPRPACVPIDLHDTFNTTGAKGLGEPATVPAATVIANAVYDATGVRVTDSPVSPRRILEAIDASARRS